MWHYPAFGPLPRARNPARCSACVGVSRSGDGERIRAPVLPAAAETAGWYPIRDGAGSPGSQAMTTEEKLLTAEEFFCLHSGSDDWTELVDGKVVQLMPLGGDHNDVLGELFGRLWMHVKERRLGRVRPGDTGVILRRGPDTVRGPDIA